MLISMKRDDFDTIDDSNLGAACFEPFIPLIRGKDIKVKEKLYQQLTTGQKALFMFKAYHNHAIKSLAEFYWWSAYYYAQPQSWSAIKAGLQYFMADAFYRLFEEMETVLEARGFQKRLDDFTVSYNDMDKDYQLLSEIEPLHKLFSQLSPETLNKIGKKIRSNPSEFIKFEE